MRKNRQIIGTLALARVRSCDAFEKDSRGLQLVPPLGVPSFISDLWLALVRRCAKVKYSRFFHRPRGVYRPATRRYKTDSALCQGSTTRFDREWRFRAMSVLRTGEASETIELARLGYVTQPRMSQIMVLYQLAPDIQEALLNLPATKGKPEIHEKRLRPIAAMLNWEQQRGAWRQICDEVGLQGDALAESAD